MFMTAKRAAGGVVWKHILPRYSQIMLHSAAGMAAVQVSLGISTLLLYVPTHLAATHQFGSLILLTFSTAALHSLKFAKVLSLPAAATGIASTNPRTAAAAASVAGAMKIMGK